MCCGSKRAAARAAAIGNQAAQPARALPAPLQNATSEIMFEYSGNRAVEMIVGPATRRTYRFDGPGSRVRVDPRDRPGLAAMPTLRWVR